MKFDRAGRRHLFSYAMAVLCFLCLVAALIPLISILYTSVLKGLPALSVDFFTNNIPSACPPGLAGCEPGGIWPAIQGSLIMIGLGSLIAVPIGVLAGIFLSEWRHYRVVGWIRFLVEVMTGLPSIVVGIFIFSLFLLAANQGVIPRDWVLSGIAGATALSVIMLPIIARTTEDALSIVPVSLREAGLALGVRRWRVTTSVVLSTGRAQVITGALLGIARAGGETAPLLVVTTVATFPARSLTGPIAAIPPLIFNFGLSGYANQVTIAWGATLVIVGIMLAISVAARLAAGVTGSRAGLGGGG
jgi:phosphate transport system permease protein